MKIIQFTTDNREHYRDRGARLPYFGAAPEALLQGFANLPDIKVSVVSCVREVMSSPRVIFGNVEYHSVVVPKIGWMSSLYAGCIKGVRNLVHDLGADLVHGQGTERDCAISACYSGLPNVITIHGNMGELNRLGITFENHKAFGFLASRLEAHALKRTKGVFCNSAYTESLVKSHADRTWRVPNAIRADFFQPFTAVRKEGIPTLVNVGVVNPRKRQLELLRMVGELVRSGSQMRIVFAGSLSEESEYGRAFVAELLRAEAAGYASFVGFLDVIQLIRLLDSSHAFLHFPSEEAFGLVVAEAMARGLKFFGSNLGGIVDISSGIEGAELFDDFETLKKGIIRWLESGAPEPALVADEIAKRYHPRVVAERHVEIYREVLGS
jgi:glycosyltransferase involved in cell wall biosynthesis